MAHLTRVRAPGMWTLNSNLLSTECEAFDSRIYKAVNGDDGGVWAPSSAIEIGGAGISITGAAAFTGGVTANNVAISNTLAVQGATTLDDDLTVNGSVAVSTDLDVQGDSVLSTLAINGALDVGFKLSVHGSSKLSGSLNVTGSGSINGAAVLSDTLSVAGDSTFDERIAINAAADPAYRLKVAGASKFTGAITGDTSLTLGGNLTVSGSTSLVGLSTSATAAFGAGITVANDADVTGDANVTGDVTAGGTITGKGRIRARTLVISTDADATIGISTADTYYLPAGVYTATRTLTLATAGAVEGDIMTIWNMESAHAITVTLAAASYSLRQGAAVCGLTVAFISGGWKPIATSPGLADDAAIIPGHLAVALRLRVALGVAATVGIGRLLRVANALAVSILDTFAGAARLDVCAATSPTDAARLAHAVAAAVRFADLRAFRRRTGAGAFNLLPGGAGSHGVGVIGRTGQ